MQKEKQKRQRTKFLKFDENFTNQQAKQKEKSAKKGASSPNKKSFLKFINGKPIAWRDAGQAMCYECMGYFEDGKIDCYGYDCPLYPFYPYKNKKLKTQSE